jgi:hypothetical protein
MEPWEEDWPPPELELEEGDELLGGGEEAGAAPGDGRT